MLINFTKMMLLYNEARHTPLSLPPAYKEPCTYHSSEMAETRDSKLRKAGWKLKLSVSKGEMETLDFLKQEHCMHKRKDVPNTGSNVKKDKYSKKVSHTEGTLE